jgi:uncharacterized protein (DUF4415 family)
MQKRRRGRPPAATTKAAVSIRLDRDVLAAWRATGRGWQTRLAASIGRLKPEPR